MVVVRSRPRWWWNSKMVVAVVRVGARSHSLAAVSRMMDEKAVGPGEAHTLLVGVVVVVGENEKEGVREGEPRRLRWTTTTMHHRWRRHAEKDCLI